MAAKIKTDTSQLDEILANFQKFTAQTIPTLVRRHARLLAVELANRTQPFSVGSTSKNAAKLGKNAVENDISKVFRTAKTLQSVVDKTQNESLKNRLQKLINSGNNKKIGETFKAVGMINEFELISKSGLAAKHKSQRSPKSGRTWSPKKSMYIATSGLSPYIKEVQRRVGYSKSAWADCARQIGGVKGDGARGIPAFAKSNNHKSSGSIIDGIKGSNPFVTMTSNISWASRILPESEIKMAQGIVRDKMIKQANMMTKAAAKKNFNPTPEDE
tara:strand:- start:185 stop:1003 length:819 start_codon:yes stop_codon:yes gene_type:complete